MEKPNIFHFEDASQYFQEMLNYYREKQIFSNRSLARHLGLKSHSLIPMIYHGNRRISIDLVGKLSNAFELGSHEKEYFQILVENQYAISDRQRREIQKEIHAMRTAHLVSPSSSEGVREDSFVGQR